MSDMNWFGLSFLRYNNCRPWCSGGWCHFPVILSGHQCKQVDRTMLLHKSSEVAYIDNTLIQTLLVKTSEIHGCMASWTSGEQVGWICTDDKTWMTEVCNCCEIIAVRYGSSGRTDFCLNIKWGNVFARDSPWVQTLLPAATKWTGENTFYNQTLTLKRRLRWKSEENIHNHKCKQINTMA